MTVSVKSALTPTVEADVVNRLSLVPIAQNADTGRWRTEAMRSHAAPRLLYISKGQGRITIAGLTSGYGPNNMIFIPANTMYGFEVGTTVFGQMLSIPLAMAGEWPEEPVHLRIRDVHAQKELFTHFDNLERELKSNKTAHTRAAHYLVGILGVFFERQLQDQPADPATISRTETSAAKLVAAFTDLIERDFRSDKGVADYAAALGVTPTHLTRCCNQTCGRSAHSLLSDRVLYEARLLLRDTRTPVQDIASRLGYTSPAYFTRAFQTRTGMTPTKFRRNDQH